jgi:hypothetical protein
MTCRRRSKRCCRTRASFRRCRARAQLGRRNGAEKIAHRAIEFADRARSHAPAGRSAELLRRAFAGAGGGRCDLPAFRPQPVGSVLFVGVAHRAEDYRAASVDASPSVVAHLHFARVRQPCRRTGDCRTVRFARLLSDRRSSSPCARDDDAFRQIGCMRVTVDRTATRSGSIRAAGGWLARAGSRCISSAVWAFSPTGDARAIDEVAPRHFRITRGADRELCGSQTCTLRHQCACQAAGARRALHLPDVRRRTRRRLDAARPRRARSGRGSRDVLRDRPRSAQLTCTAATRRRSRSRDRESWVQPSSSMGDLSRGRES